MVLLLALGLDLWQSPITTTGLPSAQACGRCHPAQRDDWSASGHRDAWTDPLFQAGFVAESQIWCASCHAPLPEMRAEIGRNLPWYRSRDPRIDRFGPPPERRPEPHAAEGVTCVACHQADGGQILGSGRAGNAPHRVKPTAALTDGTVCRGCHEFPMPRWDQGVLSFGETAMQSTFSEWQAWGGPERCVDCHMPGGRHTFPGTDDRGWLAASIAVSGERDGDRLVFALRSVGVGHALPSGDLFRHLTLELADGDGWRTIGWFGRRFETVGEERVLVGDTSLVPGQVQRVEAEAAPATAWRLRWHDGAAHDEVRGLVDPETIVATLAGGML